MARRWPLSPVGALQRIMAVVPAAVDVGATQITNRELDALEAMLQPEIRANFAAEGARLAAGGGRPDDGGQHDDRSGNERRRRRSYHPDDAVDLVPLVMPKILVTDIRRWLCLTSPKCLKMTIRATFVAR